MKALILTMLLPGLLLIGCGKMDTNKSTAGDAVTNLSDNGAISEEEANSISDSLAEEEVEVTEMGGAESIMMKVGDTELLIDFFKDLSGDPNEIAMIINGVEVAAGLLKNPDNFQALIASIVTSQLGGVDIMGIPVADLIQAGMGLITGDTSQFDFSNLVGTLVKGAMNLFLSGTPYGAIFSGILDPILDGITGGDGNTNQNNNGGGFLDGILGAIGGNGGSNNSNGSNPLLSGVFSLITNLFK